MNCATIKVLLCGSLPPKVENYRFKQSTFLDINNYVRLKTFWKKSKGTENRFKTVKAIVALLTRKVAFIIYT